MGRWRPPVNRVWTSDSIKCTVFFHRLKNYMFLKKNRLWSQTDRNSVLYALSQILHMSLLVNVLPAPVLALHWRRAPSVLVAPCRQNLPYVMKTDRHSRVAGSKPTDGRTDASYLHPDTAQPKIKLTIKLSTGAQRCAGVGGLQPPKSNF